ncbi:MAG: hypothetical protein AAF914_01640 [Pseudomonadota bacterium]
MTRLPTWAELISLMRLTLGAPREGAAAVLSDLPRREALWLIFALVIVLTVLASEIVTFLASGSILPVLSVTAGQTAVSFLILLGMHYIPRVFGGTGAFDGALILASWLQFIFIFVQFAQVALILVLPGLTTLVFAASLGLFLWLLSSFVFVLHRFRSIGRVLMGTVAVLIGMYVIVRLFTGAFGVEFGAAA